MFHRVYLYRLHTPAHNGRRWTYGSVLAFAGFLEKLTSAQRCTGSQEEADAAVDRHSRIESGWIFGILAVSAHGHTNHCDDQRKIQQYANGTGHVRFFKRDDTLTAFIIA